MNWATVAAFLAAGLSLANVTISAQLARRQSLEGWRRDAERPAVARVLTLSDSCYRTWSKAWNSAARWFKSSVNEEGPYNGPGDVSAKTEALELFKQGGNLLEELRFEVAQLDLVAGQSVRDASRAIVVVHENVQRQISPNDLFSLYPDAVSLGPLERGEFRAIERTLVAAARADLGLSRDPDEAQVLRSSWWHYLRITVRHHRDTH